MTGADKSRAVRRAVAAAVASRIEPIGRKLYRIDGEVYSVAGAGGDFPLALKAVPNCDQWLGDRWASFEVLAGAEAVAVIRAVRAFEKLPPNSWDTYQNAKTAGAAEERP